MPADITGTEVLDEEDGHRSAALREGADLRADPPRRRDQPHAAEDAGGAARGDAGVSRHRRRAGPIRSSGRSSCSRRRTRSSSKAPIRCPKRSSIASCSTSSMTYLTRGRRGPRRDADDRSGRARRRRGCSAAPTSSRSSSWCGRWSSPRKSRATPCGSSMPRGPGARATCRSCSDWVKWGAGLRASQSLILAGKARALMQRAVSRVGRRHPRAGASGPAAPHHPELLRRVGAASRPTTSSTGCSRPCRRRAAECSHGRPPRRAATSAFSIPPSSRGWGRWS